MKYYFFSLMGSILISLSAIAQPFPSFGIISQGEIALKECSFDKGAGAVVLLDEAISNYDDRSQLVTDRHIRIKILKEKGFDQADVSIYYYRKDDFETLLNLEAMVTNSNADGSFEFEKLEKKSFYKTNEDERFGKISFAFPKVKVGSIIEYRYQSVMKNYGGLRNWYFQQHIPVIKSSYTLFIAPHLEFKYSVKKRMDMSVILIPDLSSSKIFFEMNNIPALSNEPYMDAREDYLQKVEFQLSGFNRNDGYGKNNYMTTWNEAIQELVKDNDFGFHTAGRLPGAKEFISSVKSIPAAEEKMKAVYDYVRTNMRWNGLNSKYARKGIKDCWNKKQGNSGEINHILVALLKDAELEAYPMLVSERSNGKVDTKIPFIDQFNTLFAFVVINDKKYYLDGRDKSTPANIIPRQILNTNALIVNLKTGGLVTISNDNHIYSETLRTQFSIKNDGSITGEVNIKSEGYARIEKVAKLIQLGSAKYVENKYSEAAVELTNFEMLNRDSDSLPVEEKFNFTRQLPVSGDYFFVPLTNYWGFEKNPFTAETRFSNINFGYPRKIVSTSTIVLPPDYATDALPKTVKITSPDADIIIDRKVEFNSEIKGVVCVFSLEFKKSLYSVADYGILQDMFKKLYDILKEPLVLKRI